MKIKPLVLILLFLISCKNQHTILNNEKKFIETNASKDNLVEKKQFKNFKQYENEKSILSVIIKSPINSKNKKPLEIIKNKKKENEENILNFTDEAEDEYYSASFVFKNYLRKKIIKKKQKNIIKPNYNLELDLFKNKSIDFIRNTLGTEDFIRSEGNFYILQYRNKKCVIEFFLKKNKNHTFSNVINFNFRSRLLYEKVKKLDCQREISNINNND